MDNQTTQPSAAEQIMAAAGYRRETVGGNLQAWRKDHPAGEGPHASANGEFSLITADGDCDADPLAIIWTAGRYRSADAAATIATDPHHTSLARALDRVATLTVQDAPAEAQSKAAAPERFTHQPGIGEE